MGLPTLPLIWGRAVMALLVSRVGLTHKYTVHVRYFWQGNHQIYGHIQCIYTVLANPTCEQLHLRSQGERGAPGFSACTLALARNVC